MSYYIILKQRNIVFSDLHLLSLKTETKENCEHPKNFKNVDCVNSRHGSRTREHIQPP